MKYRIITHGNCTDGLCSAFIVKRNFNILFNKNLTDEEIKRIEVVGLQPKEVQLGEFELTENDVVLDLPQPKKKVFSWFDHHLTSKLRKEEFPENYYWKKMPSCCGYLLEIAFDKGLEKTEELIEFQKAIDKIDDADYTKKDIELCYYKQDNYASPTFLQKLHMVGSMYHTRDRILDDEIFKTILYLNLGETPFSTEELWQLNPLMFYIAQLKSYELWREDVDEYIYYDEKSKCVVQDDRNIKFTRGVSDRFYAYMKYPEASYGINLKVFNEKLVRVSIGSNIFHKDRCKVDINKLCFVIGKMFGDGSGGGHYHVGGAMVYIDKSDEALKFILESFRKEKIKFHLS
ncbi:MAG: hypothetical protein ABH824_02950 [Nanoarchaeota archaeon]|nr:hypothetical protein [Nanoarchaeota archaeon]MBU1632066.1 hypothetical protein [Nanoarchaeota archaeon]MBU1875700.1 hypothetical protein [Nanoarchaeota archaeon]